MFVLLDALSALTALSELDPKQMDEQVIIQNSVDILLKYNDIYSCSIFLVQGNKLRCLAGKSRADKTEPDGKHGCNSFNETEGIMGVALQSGESYYCSNTSLDKNYVDRSEMSVPAGSILSIPLRIDEQNLGVLNVSHPMPDFFEPYALRVFELFSAWLARQLMTTRQYACLNSEVSKRTRELNAALISSEELRLEFKALSLTDDLTRMGNRRYFFSAAESWLRQALMDKGYISLILLDLDYFKQVNDKWGHVVGDKVLQSIGKILNNVIRENDLLARLGGEEFVILVDSSLEQTKAFAERIQQEFLTLEIPDVDGITITASVGVTVHNLADDEDYVSIDRLYQEADEAMYLSKHHGRNRVSVYGDS